MLARVLAMALCLSVTSRCSIKRNERINLFFLEWRLFRPALSFNEIHVHCMYKNNGTSLWTLFLNSGLKKIWPRHIDRRACYQLILSWRKVDAQSVINWTVVGQLS